MVTRGLGVHGGAEDVQDVTCADREGVTGKELTNGSHERSFFSVRDIVYKSVKFSVVLHAVVVTQNCREAEEKCTHTPKQYNA